VEVAIEAVGAGVVVDISAATMRRWLRADAIKPWQYRSWIAPRATDFAQRAARVSDLYAGVFDGEPLGDDDYVLSADEKTSIQARCRCHPTLAPGVARMMRVEHEYTRGGATAYLAAWDVHRGKVHGRCEALALHLAIHQDRPRRPPQTPHRTRSRDHLRSRLTPDELTPKTTNAWRVAADDTGVWNG
jgi:hypothetical protein